MGVSESEVKQVDHFEEFRCIDCGHMKSMHEIKSDGSCCQTVGGTSQQEDGFKKCSCGRFMSKGIMDWLKSIEDLGEIEVKHQPHELCDCHPEINPFHCHAHNVTEEYKKENGING